MEKQQQQQKKKNVLRKPVTEEVKSWLKIMFQETRKNPQNRQDRSKCVRLEKLIGGL